MTPAIESLKKADIHFTIHEYAHDALAASYGEEAASRLNIEAHRVFKTLVISIHPSDNTKQLAVAIIPVSHKLDLKSAAKSLKAKKAQMANASAAQNATGYILGGISPLGQKKRLPFILDSSAQNLEKVFVSGGKRGLEIELSPFDLIKLCSAKTAHLTA